MKKMQYKLYVLLDFVNDMMDTLYYTGVDIQNKRWSARIREKFSTVDDYECGGHAALADNNIDYWIFIDDTCYLGDIPHGSGVYIDDDIKEHVNLNRGIFLTIKAKFLV